MHSKKVRSEAAGRKILCVKRAWLEIVHFIAEEFRVIHFSWCPPRKVVTVFHVCIYHQDMVKTSKNVP